MNTVRIRLAIAGGHRGEAFMKSIMALSDKVELKLVCDVDADVLARWQSRYPGIQSCSTYEELLDHPEIDAVLIATPLPLHARHAVEALNHGKHVLCEVTAAQTLEQCWELVETVERTGLVYMMAENYCYTRPAMMLKRLVAEGRFGELTYAEGGYIHDTRDLLHDSSGGLTWRGELRHKLNGMQYPTHALGPVAQWLDINRAGGDEFESLVTVVSKEAAGAKYMNEQFGSSHPGAQREFWSQGDTAVTLIRTRKGALIQLRQDGKSARPHNMNHYALQGTAGAYLAPRFHGEDPLVWLEGVSQGRSPHNRGEAAAQWESLWTHADRYEHPAWQTYRTEAEQAGHGGGDFFVMLEFVSSILEKRRPDIDVYDAVTRSAVSPLSELSLAGGGRVEFPRFKRSGI
jgi:predicted dehydrogenase